MSDGVIPGRPVDLPLGLGYQAPDPGATVEFDVPCRRCSYNLRGLTYGGRCPECGTPVGLSTGGDLLRYSDPNWLQKLARGLSFILWGILVELVIVIIGSIALQGSSPAAQQWLNVVAGLMGVWGAWLLTEPDPSGLGEQQYATSRKLVRITLLVGLIGGALKALAESIGLPAEAIAVVGLVTGLAALMGVVGEFAMFTYLEKLARRIPDDRLAGRALFLRWAYGISLSVVIVAGLALTAAGPGGGAGAVFGCFALLAFVALIVFGIMAIFFYIRLRRAFVAQGLLSRQVWGSALATQAGSDAPQATPSTQV